MRPTGIVWFERLMIAAVILGGVYIAVSWHFLAATAELITPDPTAYIVRKLAMTACLFALMIVFTLLISRRRSKIAIWPLIAMLVYTLWILGHYIQDGRLTRYPPIQAVQLLLFLTAISLLALRSSRDWLQRRSSEPSLEETFS